MREIGEVVAVRKVSGWMSERTEVDIKASGVTVTLNMQDWKAKPYSIGRRVEVDVKLLKK